MSMKIKILLVDDDPMALSFLEFKLRSALPVFECETRTEPNIDGAFDIYFLDNDFQGRRVAAELASRIRQERPNALIIAFSGTLDSQTLKNLINAGCSGACDKSQPGDLDEALKVTRKYIDTLQRQRESEKPQRGGIVDAVRSIRGLLDSWNTRLDQQQRESERTK